MSGAEAIMWAVEKDPALRSDFCNLTLLDAPPDPDHLQHTVARALTEIPRLRQRVIGAPLRMVPPEFADDPTLDLEAHVKAVGLPGPGDDRSLLDLCGQIAEQPFDRARPLWEFTLITGLRDGRAALLQKVHHTITDGEGGLRLSLALVDFERTPPPAADTGVAPPRSARHDTPLAVARHAVADATSQTVGIAKQSLAGVGHLLTHPGDIPRRAGDAGRLVSSMQRQGLVTDAAHSDVFNERSLRRRFDMHRMPLGALRDASSSLGGSVNDGFVTLLASAFGRYHERMGSAVDELRMAMPVSTRERGDRQPTNAFAPARLLVPIQPAHDIGALFKDVHTRLDAAKAERALLAADGLAGWAAALPTSVLVALARSQTRTIDFAASNLRGSPVQLYLAGSKILANFPFGPRTTAACNVTMLSYCDELHFGINSDPAAITDIDGFLRDVAAAGDELLSYR